MANRIFLSHTHKDKPVVEAVAIRLAEIFGKEHVFYDSWSIQPGEGIIDKMNDGLEAPDFVFFFVSQTSLASNMVKLEWQNALYAATNGKTRIIPVRVDGSDLPAILTQNLYIDMHTIGLEAAIVQIVGVAQGTATFTPQHLGFSNLTYSAIVTNDGTIEVSVRASHLMEPNPKIAFAVANPKSEIDCLIPGAIALSTGFKEDALPLKVGGSANFITASTMNDVLTPDHPMQFQLVQKTENAIQLIAVMHEKTKGGWVLVPPDADSMIRV